MRKTRNILEYLPDRQRPWVHAILRRAYTSEDPAKAQRLLNDLARRLEDEFLDMGKCCVHFESPDDLPLEAIGQLISASSSEKWIETYEQSRLMIKAGKVQMAKQGAPSASKVAAKRVDTKRRR